MDLTRRLLRLGAARPHVLVVPAVGGTGARLAVEAELARRGWPIVGSPADADVLAVAGEPGSGLRDVVEAVWRRIPAPRARVEVLTPGTVAVDLERALAVLVDPRHQRASAATTHPGGGGRAEHRGHGMDHGVGGGNHGHGGGDMPMPAGLPMAELGEDRDGLMLDQLHVPLGPALPDWPAGLVLRVVLQGDVVQQAQVEVLDAAGQRSFWDGAHSAARELDALGRLLAVAAGTTRQPARGGSVTRSSPEHRAVSGPSGPRRCCGGSGAHARCAGWSAASGFGTATSRGGCSGG